ncbi:hypothetical protein LTR85_004721 [Meristemomyces frigidus]|nr:hypothetical protein LTR85_004721 [Meristemomyces frigidus]
MAPPHASSEGKPSPFQVAYMTSSDFSLMLTPSHRRGGDLVTPPISPLCWPIPEGDEADGDEALRRLEYSTSLHKAFFDRDPTVHCIKAINPDDGEIVSIARWNFFPRGYEFERDEVVDVGEFLPDGALAPEGPYVLDLYRDLRTKMMRERRDWTERGNPCWGTKIDLDPVDFRPCALPVC